MAITEEEYIDLVFDAQDYIANTVIRGIMGAEGQIETRYITSEGTDDEQWYGFLRDDEGNVDIWISALSSLLKARSSGIGVIDKPVRFIFDYYTDYKFGTDEVNTQREFEKKILKLDLALEQKADGLDCDDPVLATVQIADFNISMGIKRFSSASCHFAKCTVTLLFTEIQYK